MNSLTEKLADHFPALRIDAKTVTDSSVGSRTGEFTVLPALRIDAKTVTDSSVGSRTGEFTVLEGGIP